MLTLRLLLQNLDSTAPPPGKSKAFKLSLLIKFERTAYPMPGNVGGYFLFLGAIGKYSFLEKREGERTVLSGRGVTRCHSAIQWVHRKLPATVNRPQPITKYPEA